jgi:hypothetical protein
MNGTNPANEWIAFFDRSSSWSSSLAESRNGKVGRGDAARRARAAPVDIERRIAGQLVSFSESQNLMTRTQVQRNAPFVSFRIRIRFVVVSSCARKCAQDSKAAEATLRAELERLRASASTSMQVQLHKTPTRTPTRKLTRTLRNYVLLRLRAFRYLQDARTSELALRAELAQLQSTLTIATQVNATA